MINFTVMSKRIEKDSIGNVEVDSSKYWGAQTQRSLQNFDIGYEKMPWEIIESFAVLKMAAAETNCDLGVLDKKKMEVIVGDFLSQYYKGQEYKGGPIDLIENIDKYIKLRDRKSVV